MKRPSDLRYANMGRRKRTVSKIVGFSMASICNEVSVRAVSQLKQLHTSKSNSTASPSSVSSSTNTLPTESTIRTLPF